MSDTPKPINQLDEENSAVFQPLDEDLPSITLTLSISSPHHTTETPGATLEDTPRSDGSTSLDESSHFAATSLTAEIDNQNIRFATRRLLSPWFPRIDPDSPQAQTFTVKRSQRQVMIYIALCLAILVLVVNLTALILFHRKWKSQNGFGVLFHGDCNKSHRLNILLHLIINALSTLLMAASNMCMQLLSAPTRSEVDVAHRKKSWVDIGTPSLRNLKSMSKQRVFVWFVLGLASLPLHFFYNSAISPTVPVNAFVWAMVTPDFLSGRNWNLSETIIYQSHWPGIPHDPGSVYHDIAGDFEHYDEALRKMQQSLNNSTIFKPLENARCFAQYRQLLGNHSDLLLVTTGKRVSRATADMLQIAPEYIPSTDTLRKNSVVAYGEDGKATWEQGWNFCGTTNGVKCIQPHSKLDGAGTNVTDWSIGGFLIDYCLSSSHSLQNLCSIEYSFVLVIVVCIFNSLKVVCIVYTAIYFSRKENKSISTFGDAVSSFLEHQDPATTSMSSVISKASLSKDPNAWEQIMPSTWTGKRWHFYQAVSCKRWSIFFLSFLCLITTACIFLGNGIAALRLRLGEASLTTVFDMGFGSVNVASMLGILQGHTNTAAGLYKNALFANSWQFEISLIYVILNSIISTILASAEWDRFAQDRKFLRVTSPMGLQRTSYFVSMPAKYGIPLISIFGILHWSISQSVFVVRIVRYYSTEVSINDHLIACGYSCVAIIVSMGIGVLIIVLLVVFGMKKFPNGMPLAATCSAAISAACHPPQEDTEPHLFPVKWGVVTIGSGGGHCAFTSANDIRFPDKGETMM